MQRKNLIMKFFETAVCCNRGEKKVSLQNDLPCLYQIYKEIEREIVEY
jgi:hypothetical protein